MLRKTFDGVLLMVSLFIYAMYVLIRDIAQGTKMVIKEPKRLIDIGLQVLIKIITAPLAVVLIAYYIVRYELFPVKGKNKDLTKTLVDNNLIR